MFGYKTVVSLRGLAIANVLLLLCLIFVSLNTKNECFLYKLSYCESGNNTNLWHPLELVGDNITGYPLEIVPNIFHYILFDINEIEFAHFISILSVLRHHRPQQIIIHCNCVEIKGSNWKMILERANSSNTIIRVREVVKPNQIFNIPLRKKWVNWHSSDITRIKILMQFGGIYLDNDIYVVKSLDIFRKFEMTLNWDLGHYLGNQVIIANRNARFLKLWIAHIDIMTEVNGIIMQEKLPSKAILNKFPHLIHRLTGEFGVDGYESCHNLYRIYLPNWREKYYTIHLYMRDHRLVHYWCISLALHSPVMYYDKENVKYLKVTFAEMARLVLYNSTQIFHTL